MIAVASAGALYALYDSSDRLHVDFLRLFQRADLSIVTADLVLPEADHLVHRHLGDEAQADFLEGLSGGSITVEPTAQPDWSEAARLVAAHPTLSLGLADATLVAVARRLGADAVLAGDPKRFRPLLRGSATVVLPADL